MKLLELMENVVRSAVGWALGEEVLWSILQSSWKLSRVSTASHLLRVYAENMLKHVVRVKLHFASHIRVSSMRYVLAQILTMFSRLQDMPAVEDDDEVSARSPHEADPQGPYGVKTLARVLQWLSSLLDPSSNDKVKPFATPSFP